MSINSTTNPVNSWDDGTMDDVLAGPQYDDSGSEAVEGSDLSGDSSWGANSYGSPSEHVTREQYLQVYNGVKDSKLSEKDKDQLLAILKDALTSDNEEELNEVESSLAPVASGSGASISGDPQLDAAFQENGDGSEEAPDNTQPDNVEGDTAKYISKSEVDLTPSFGDVKKHDIKTPGKVTIHLPNYSSTAEILKDQPGIGDYTLKVHNNGSNKADDTETYVIHTTPTTTIDIEGALIDSDKPASVTYNGQPYSLGVDPKLTIAGASDALSKQYPKAVNDLANLLNKGDKEGVHQDEIEAAAQTAGLDFNHLPAIPDEKVFHFLTLIDPDLKQGLLDFSNASHMQERNILRKQIGEQLQNDLQKLYSTKSIKYSKKTDGDGSITHEIVFKGQNLMMIDQNVDNWSKKGDENEIWKILNFSMNMSMVGS